MKYTRRFRHLDQYDRDRIQALLSVGHKQKDIAQILGVSKSCLSREIANRTRADGRYCSNTAQHKAQVKRLNSKYQGMKIEAHPDLRTFIIAQLKRHRSPDEIAGRLKKESISPCIGPSAIYKWLYSSYGQRYCKYLCTKRYKPRRQKKDKTKRAMIPDLVSIHERSGAISRKEEYGHFEGDTAVNGRKHQRRQAIALAVERKLNYIVGTKLSALGPKQMKQAMHILKHQASIQSLTLDRGQENRSHALWGIPTYFCDPHSPWQKPQVETNIGLLRRWFIPKKTDLGQISEEKLQEYISILNHKYRKSLQYKSAHEAALEAGLIQANP